MKKNNNIGFVVITADIFSFSDFTIEMHYRNDRYLIRELMAHMQNFYQIPHTQHIQDYNTIFISADFSISSDYIKEFIEFTKIYNVEVIPIFTTKTLNVSLSSLENLYVVQNYDEIEILINRFRNYKNLSNSELDSKSILAELGYQPFKNKTYPLAQIYFQTEGICYNEITIDNLFKYAKQQNIKHFGIVNDEKLVDIDDLNKTAQKYNMTDVNVCCGASTNYLKYKGFYIKVILYAKNKKGYTLLKNFFAEELKTCQKCQKFLKLVKNHKDFICIYLESIRDEYSDIEEKLEFEFEKLKFLKGLFKEDLYIGLDEIYAFNEKGYKHLINFAKRLNIEPIICNQVLYFNTLEIEDDEFYIDFVKDDRCLVPSHTHSIKKVSDLSFKWLNRNLFDSAIKNTQIIAEKCKYE